MNAQHSSKTNEHFTPSDIIERARRTLGRIDVDPASCAQAQRVVQAHTFYTARQNGLRKPWPGTVFLNPPGGTLGVKGDRKSRGVKKDGVRKGLLIKGDPPALAKYKRETAKRFETESHTVAWWRALMDQHTAGVTTAAIFVGFSLEILQAAQDGDAGAWMSPTRFAFCIPAKRIRFSGNAPTHSNVIVCVGGNRLKFLEAFEELGDVCNL